MRPGIQARRKVSASSTVRRPVVRPLPANHKTLFPPPIAPHQHRAPTPPRPLSHRPVNPIRALRPASIGLAAPLHSAVPAERPD